MAYAWLKNRHTGDELPLVVEPGDLVAFENGSPDQLKFKTSFRRGSHPSHDFPATLLFVNSINLALLQSRKGPLIEFHWGHKSVNGHFKSIAVTGHEYNKRGRPDRWDLEVELLLTKRVYPD